MATFLGATFLGRHDDRLADRVGEWVRAGIVSRDQADAIVRYERGDAGPAPVARLTIGAEVAAYLGSVLALMGSGLVVGRQWEQLALTGRLAIAAAITMVGFVAGTWLVRLGESGTSRLGMFLWAVGSGGAAMLVAVLADRIVDDPGWTRVTTGLAVLALGACSWRGRDRPLQFLTAVAGFVIVLAGVGELVQIPTWVGSSVLIVTGGGVAVAGAAGRIVPRDLAIAVGALGAFVGAIALGDVNRHLGPLAALAVATVLVVHALTARRPALLAVGVIGTLIATQAVLMTTFSGALASLLVAVLGLVVVVVAVLRGLRRSPEDGVHSTSVTG